MSHSLKLFKRGGYIRDYKGDYYRRCYGGYWEISHVVVSLGGSFVFFWGGGLQATADFLMYAWRVFGGLGAKEKD